MSQRNRLKEQPYNRDLLGKLPPQALDIEEAVLGAALLERSGTIALLAKIQTPEVFYMESHQLIYSAIRSLKAKGEPVDLLTVTSLLRDTGELEAVGGAYYITQLTSKVNSSSHIHAHMMILTEKWVARELISFASEIHKQCFDDTCDIPSLLNSSQLHILNVQNRLSSKEARSVSAIIPEVIEEWQEAQNRKDGLIGLSSGITKVDKYLQGWQKGKLYIVAARPGMGKTAFIIQAMHHLIKIMPKVRIALFSLEMSEKEMVGRLIVRECEVSTFEITKRNGPDLETMKQWARGVESDNVLVDDTSAQSIQMLHAKAVALKAKGGLDLVLIDYMQLAESDNKSKGNREQEISAISRGMKRIAKDLDVPVIALSQLSREVEKRANKRPILADLRESGSIEQDADAVIFLYRAEYYKIEVDTFADNTEYNTKGMCEVNIAKHRGGHTGEILAECDVAINKFSTPEEGRIIVEHKEKPEDKTDWANIFDQQYNESSYEKES